MRWSSSPRLGQIQRRPVGHACGVQPVQVRSEHKKSSAKQRPFSLRTRVRLSEEGLRALTYLHHRSELTYGRIIEIVLAIYFANSHKSKSFRRVGPSRRKIVRIFPHYKTVTVRKDLAQRAIYESSYKAYTCRSFYVGAAFLLVLNNFGFWRLLRELKRRPDLSKALNYEPAKRRRSTVARLRRRLQTIQ
jgi:hypothetical protein